MSLKGSCRMDCVALLISELGDVRYEAIVMRMTMMPKMPAPISQPLDRSVYTAMVEDG